MRVIAGRIGAVAKLGVCVLIAVGLSMIVRPLTAGLNRTLGTVWPFSTVHCDSARSPGCEPDGPASRRIGLASR